MNINEIAKQIKLNETPCYIFDENKLKERMDLVDKYLGQYDICYAMKANPFLINSMDKLVIDRFEVCSPGEYEICIKNNISPEKIVVSGVNKTIESIERIFDYSKGLGIYTIESIKHFEILSQCAEKMDVDINVIVRLSSGNQFGIDKEVFENIIDRICDDIHLNVVGIHYYSGTQKKIDKIKKELEYLEEYGAFIKSKFHIDYLELEYGPGLVVDYFQDKKTNDEKEQLIKLKDLLDKIENYDKISLEFGRFIAASCGYYVTRINDIKTTSDIGYIIVDGGVHQLNYYGQIMGMKKPFMSLIKNNKQIIPLEADKNKEKWIVCGSLCTVNDVIVRDIGIDNPSIEDILVFENTGAYSVTEGMALFLSRQLPQIWLYTLNKEWVCIRDMMETYEINS